MTNKEATKYLIVPVATSTKPSAEYLKQKEAYDLAIKALEDRPQGEWKEYKLRNDIVVEYAFKCSNCKKDSGLVYRTDFCLNCGADMRGKKNESGNEL